MWKGLSNLIEQCGKIKTEGERGVIKQRFSSVCIIHHPVKVKKFISRVFSVSVSHLEAIETSLGRLEVWRNEQDPFHNS